ncbi:ABC transporter permease [Agromyces aerolatus]|uniref:ABC transporter permease n=1 Tax=Agromyces sp. LY-1074 TaxID=3074080 RepID=UPI00285BECF2|nr:MULTISPECIES: ABC transporter permease [unclassified Agromyces]MDR5699034.1 ABC transporter permease [Agromyces sp. LY-1074]MDR5705188.1 ABC transporter permease [Agromyces sp. LY-1358]
MTNTVAIAVQKTKRRPTPIVDRIALGVIGVIIVIAIIGPFIAPYDPYKVDLAAALEPPSAAHWFGTDLNGRDVLSRVLAGAQITLSATGVVLVITLVIGITVGSIAALGNRVVDEVLMRITDIGLALPSIILALGFAVALGPGLESAVIAVAATWWPGYARLVRSVVREVKHAEYVEAATALGASRWRLVRKHILPNSLDAMYVQVTLDVAAVMLVISGLSFIGVGAQVPSPEWGAMIAAAAGNVTNGWWSLLFPGLAIAITAISFNLAGDWIRVKRDPTLREGAAR